MKADNATAEGQRILDTFVRQNVHYSISQLIGELSQEPTYWDSIMEFSSKSFDSKNDDEVELITKDFSGLTIWGRTCSGQSISLDCRIMDNIK